MTPRGLVLGNSHTACLREAWRAAPPDSFDLKFLAAHREKMSGLVFRDGEAVAETEDLRATLDKLSMPSRFRLDAYDFYVVTACQLAIFRAVEASRGMAVWPDRAGNRMLVSRPAFRAALADRLRDTTAFRLVQGLSPSGRPILVLPQPHPHESILLPKSTFAGFRRIDGDGQGAWLDAMFREACDAAMAGTARVLPQPDQTRAREICTSAEYSEGSVMLAANRHAHRADDVIHANQTYGALQLAQIGAALDAALRPVDGNAIPSQGLSA